MLVVEISFAGVPSLLVTVDWSPGPALLPKQMHILTLNVSVYLKILIFVLKCAYCSERA